MYPIKSSLASNLTMFQASKLDIASLSSSQLTIDIVNSFLANSSKGLSGTPYRIGFVLGKDETTAVVWNYCLAFLGIPNLLPAR